MRAKLIIIPGALVVIGAQQSRYLLKPHSGRLNRADLPITVANDTVPINLQICEFSA